jgi:acyl-CoA hydrolase/GNAT superfamily N-acetyltransferase
MGILGQPADISPWRERFPEKFVPLAEVFGHVRRGDRIFIGTACGEPQHLVSALIDYVESNPHAFFDTEVLHVWTLGVAPYTDPKFRRHFRLNSFFIGNNTRSAVNQGLADYTPISLSQVVALIERGRVPIDVALVQLSPPDAQGFMSLGISVDIVKAAVERAQIVIGQVNSHMPRVLGDTFLNIKAVDFLIPHEEPLLTYIADPPDEISQKIGKYVARIVRDGDTIQVGYGSIPNAILSNLKEKNHLGVHTELLSDGLVDLMEHRVVDNSRKSIDRGKTVATFCMGSPETYRYLHDHPAIDFRPTSYTNDPLRIAQQANMVAINTCLEIDLTGQASAESLGTQFYSGIGGQADFMRGAALAHGGRTILALQSTAAGGGVSRIVPEISSGAGVTLTRTDVQYVVTEYGIAYVHGKNIRERAMDLIAIAHPDFRADLIERAKARNLIYADQKYVPGVQGEYPEDMEARRTTHAGHELLLRPVKISDEPLLQDFFRAVSDETLYRRFISIRTDMPHERLQEFIQADHSRHVVLLAVAEKDNQEEVLGIGQFFIRKNEHTAEAGLIVRDDLQGQGIGYELLSHLTQLARRRGLLGFTAQVLIENRPMLHLFEKMGFSITKRTSAGMYQMELGFEA